MCFIGRKQINLRAYERVPVSHRYKIITEQEILEEYIYKDRTGNYDKAYIVILVKREKMTAVIDFKDLCQCENFVCPAWLSELYYI